MSTQRTEGYTGCPCYIKKSNRHTGKMTEALFLETAQYEGQLQEQGELDNWNRWRNRLDKITDVTRKVHV